MKKTKAFERLQVRTLLPLILISMSCAHQGTGRFPAGYSLSTSNGLQDQQIVSASSAGPLQLQSARVIIDNDEAFDAKIRAIQSAASGETIRLSYYIYSSDHSSSFFNQELIAAAKRGVQVRLLVDFITNYSNLDLFSMLEREGQGNIQVKLFGRPSDLVMRDVRFMTTACSKENKERKNPQACAVEKWETVKNNPNFADQYFQSLMLSGLYGRSATAIEQAFALGTETNLTAGSAAAMTAEQKKQLSELLQMIYDVKIKGDRTSAVKLYMATAMYGKTIKPVLNQIYGALPLEQMKNQSSEMDWEHLSDYTHQKLILVGNRYFQLGGRNIENAYHMKQNALSSTYTFLDTDFAADVVKGGDSIANAFDRQWNFTAMAWSVADVRKYVDNDFVKNEIAVQSTVKACAAAGALSNRDAAAKCLADGLVKDGSYKNLQARMDQAVELMNKNSNTYKTVYAPKKKTTITWQAKQAYKGTSSYDDKLAANDVNQSLTTYIENVHFNPTTGARVFGSMHADLLSHGKAIQALIVAGLENTCVVAQKEQKPKRIIFHSAYWMPPAAVLRAFKKMIDGTWNCRNVKVTVLTNSKETTDLSVINMFSRYEMKALFDSYYNRLQDYGANANNAAQFEYYEYKVPAGVTGSKVNSLHTKLTVLGDDVIIGSANMDVRSYSMDANNGVYLRNAKQFVQDYSAWIDSVTADKRIIESKVNYVTVSLQKMAEDDKNILMALKSKYSFLSKLSDQQMGQIIGAQQKLVLDVYNNAMKLLSDKAYSGFKADADEVVRQEAISKDRNEVEDHFDREFSLL